MMTAKTCPFHQGFTTTKYIDALTGEGIIMNIDEKLKKCDGAGCQLWVNLVKDTPYVIDPDQKFEWRYEGCGLIQQIPWKTVEREKEGEKK